MLSGIFGIVFGLLNCLILIESRDALPIVWFYWIFRVKELVAYFLCSK
jgi:hypothetical protein